MLRGDAVAIKATKHRRLHTQGLPITPLVDTISKLLPSSTSSRNSSISLRKFTTVSNTKMTRHLQGVALIVTAVLLVFCNAGYHYHYQQRAAQREFLGLNLARLLKLPS